MKLIRQALPFILTFFLGLSNVQAGSRLQNEIDFLENSSKVILLYLDEDESSAGPKQRPPNPEYIKDKISTGAAAPIRKMGEITDTYPEFQEYWKQDIVTSKKIMKMNPSPLPKLRIRGR
jgi:hypothetical protein